MDGELFEVICKRFQDIIMDPSSDWGLEYKKYLQHLIELEYCECVMDDSFRNIWWQTLSKNYDYVGTGNEHP